MQRSETGENWKYIGIELKVVEGVNLIFWFSITNQYNTHLRKAAERNMGMEKKRSDREDSEQICESEYETRKRHSLLHMEDEVREGGV